MGVLTPIRGYEHESSSILRCLCVRHHDDARHGDLMERHLINRRRASSPSVCLVLLPSAAGIAVAWLFSVWGSADLLNAFYQANHAGLLAGQLGAAFFLPTLVVPLLLITHGLAFRILLLPQKSFAVEESRYPA
jgi:hypothetical protein